MTDITIYAVLATIVAIIIGLLSFFRRSDNGEKKPRPPGPNVGAEGPGRRIAAPNRMIAQRNARARMRAAGARQQDESEEEGEEVSDVEEDIALPDGKIGKKKLAKLQAKAEKRAMREAEEREREEKKEREEQAAEERKKREEMRAELEAKRKEQEEKEREERERKEHEEYLALKAQFEVSEEGFDEEADEEKERNLLEEFVNFIKNEKMVVLEELAARFSLKTQDVINRIKELQEKGTLTGVIDDRGKFIYISREDMQAVAKFIKQRGRVTVTELAESSNQLISLTPVNQTETECPS